MAYLRLICLIILLVKTGKGSSKMHRVFVYGTLKTGEPNHGWFGKSEAGTYKFVCDARTVEKYPLIIGTRYNIPFVLYSPGNGTNVKGEIYEVDDDMLAHLDVLEDHPNFYVREETDVQTLDGKSKFTAWLYFIKNFKKSLLTQRMFESYSSSGEHGLKYVDRYLRRNGVDHKNDILEERS